MNPFRPGAGLRPPILAGRDALFGDFDIVRRRITEFREGDRSWILTGHRGVGKTVLIGELERTAKNDAWIVAKLEVQKGRHGSIVYRLDRPVLCTGRGRARAGHRRCGDGVAVRELAHAMDKPSASSLSVPRDELIKKGLVYAQKLRKPTTHRELANSDAPCHGRLGGAARHRRTPQQTLDLSGTDSTLTTLLPKTKHSGDHSQPER